MAERVFSNRAAHCGENYMIVMGIDYGEKRIGVALSDPEGTTARPLSVIARESRLKDAARITDLVQRFHVEVIVVGLPINMDGSQGPSAQLARRFAARLKHTVPVEVKLWDERLSTWEADQQMLASGLSPARRRELRDAVAAAVILQDYLNADKGAGHVSTA